MRDGFGSWSPGGWAGTILPGRLFVVFLLVCAVSGSLLAWWSVDREIEQERSELLRQAASLAKAQNIEQVKRLLGPGRGRGDSFPAMIGWQLEEIRTGFPRCRDVHLLVSGPGGTVDHLAAGRKERSAKDPFRGLPSDPFQQAVRSVLAGEPGRLVGPWRDEDGSWMLAMEGVREPRSGVVVAVAAMRFDASDRTWRLAGRALPYGGAAVVLMALAVWGIRLRNNASLRRNSVERLYLGGWLVTGMVVTSLVAWELNRQERLETRTEFIGFAKQKAQAIAEKMRIVRETELESLVRFIAGSEEVTGTEFQHFSSFLLRNPLVDSWSWVVRVDSVDRRRFEDSVRRHRPGMQGIWEVGASGRVAAKGRASHLVLSDIAPGTGREDRLGFDYLSDPVRLAAYLKAQSFRIPVSTPPIGSELDGKVGNALLLMRPVFESRDSSRLKGLVVATMEPGAPLREVMQEQGVRYELLRLRADSAPELLAAAGVDPIDRPGRFDELFPFFGFGTVFAVRVVADERSLRGPPHRMGATALLLGIFATFGAVVLFGGLLRRRDQLQSLVEERTDALQTTERSYRDQFQANSTVMLLIDPRDRRIVDANEAACRFYGHERERLLGMRITDIDCTPEAEVGQSPDGDLLGRGKRHEFRHRLADGQVRDVEISSSFVRFGGGQVLHAIVHDVTERKRIESERRLLEQRLEWALQATGDGVWDWNIATGTVKHNARWCQILGLDESFLQHPLESFAQRIHPDDREGVMAKVRSSLRDGVPYVSEHRMVRLDGVVVDVLDRGQVVERDQDGEPARMVGSMVDVTERKRAESELRASEARLKMVMDLAKIAPWECDLQTGIFEFNDQFYALYGTDAKAQGGNSMAIHTYLERFIPEEARKSAGEAIARTLVSRSGEDALLTLEHAANKADGAYMEVAVSYRIVRDASGKPIRTIGANQDITERKRAEAVLRETNAILEEQTARANALAAEAEMATVAKSEFLANMSHEIRTPMNGVIGMTGLLLDTELTGEQRRFAEIVKQSSESLLALLNDILDFSKIEAGKLEMENLDFDLRTMLDDFAASLALRAEEKGLEFVCRIDSNVPRFLRGDPGRLRQVITNLAGNAVKFTKFGEVLVRASLLWENGQEAELRFSVKDTGIGIPSDKISLLFNKFSQVDASTTRQFGGTGLGLAISKQLCEMMGGTIGIVSEAGKGSEFWFTARFAKQESPEDPGLDLSEVRSARILVVDDNLTSREAVASQIQAWGGRVESASGGEEAISSLVSATEAGDPFRVAIVDLHMPGMDGDEVLRRMKEDPRMRDTRFVLMTSMGRQRERERAVVREGVPLLSKPIRQSDLFDVLAAELAGRERSADRVVEAFEPQGREARAKPVRILLAEDNVVNQMVARGILERMGARVDVAGNGIEAIEALRSLPYDIVFLDVQMPEMDGLEASRRIRAGDAGDAASQLPVIAMTANAMQGDREICLAAGMDDYVPKPVSPKDLVAVIDKWTTRTESDPVTTFLEPEEPLQDQAGQVPDASVEPPVFDREGFLARVLGNQALARKVAGSFLGTMPGLIESMKDLVDSGDTRAAGDLAHAIKGAAANVGAEALRDVAARMETAGKALDLAALQGLRPVLESRHDALRKALEAAF